MNQLLPAPMLPKIYRGVMQPIPECGAHAFIREDRLPRDTGNRLAFNICFNLMIERYFGVPQVRHRSLFVCGDIRNVARYAKVVDQRHIGIIEPIGPFRFLYANNVFDSAELSQDLTERYLACFHDWQRPMCKLLLTDTTLTLQKMQAFFAANPDVDKGGFSWSKSRLQERLVGLLDSLFASTFRRTYHYAQNDLVAAAAAGVEIMIFDCVKGYRITRVNAAEFSTCRQISTPMHRSIELRSVQHDR